MLSDGSLLDDLRNEMSGRRCMTWTARADLRELGGSTQAYSSFGGKFAHTRPRLGPGILDRADSCHAELAAPASPASTMFSQASLLKGGCPLRISFAHLLFQSSRILYLSTAHRVSISQKNKTPVARRSTAGRWRCSPGRLRARPQDDHFQMYFSFHTGGVGQFMSKCVILE